MRVCTVGKMEKFMLGMQMQKNLRMDGQHSFTNEYRMTVQVVQYLLLTSM